MNQQPSKSQINKLGRRLRHGESPSDDDLDLLARYQTSLNRLMGDSLEVVMHVFETVIPEQRFEANIRGKQLRSIVEKLKRQQTSLASIQDLVGARVVVARAVNQENLAQQLPASGGWKHVDRRARPSHGYRALHLIHTEAGQSVEIQIRTQLQHQWAELSERWDRVHPGIKYGDGPDDVIQRLTQYSRLIAGFETREVELDKIVKTEQKALGAIHEGLRLELESALQEVPVQVEP